MGVAINITPQMKKERVVEIARRIRKLVESTEMFFPTLSEACVLASGLLADALSVTHQEPTTLVGGIFKCDCYDDDNVLVDVVDESHVWLTWNGYILDITATQFGVQEEVYITDNDHRYIREESVPIHNFGEFNKDNVWIHRWTGWHDDYEPLVLEARKIAEGV